LTIKISSPSTPSPSSSSDQQQHIAEQLNNKKENKRRFRRTKQKMEYELDEIFRRLCNGESDFQIMTTLNLQERNYYKYKKKVEARLMEYQTRKTDDTLFLECHLFKNRMLTLYKALETKMLDSKTSGVEIARCADVASSIAVQIVKLESEGIRAVKELGLATATAEAGRNKNNSHHHDNQQHQLEEQEEDDNSRKF
jgi:cobalamin biosynthesis Co2+ chelatase CbiK